MINDEKKIFVTPEGLEKLKSEYKELTEVKRTEIAERIKEARDLGDLSENSEYKSAREEQAKIEGRIAELEEVIKRAAVVKKVKDKKRVDIGCVVKVHLEGQEQEFRIVGATEANPAEGKISHESPLGRALLGKKVGEKVQVEAPAGNVVYKILDIVF
jgi:transcription elongation factor GreA